jgi:protein required for attachment to host cells
MTMHWILVADASRAAIYATGPLLESFDPVRELTHRESRAPLRELVSDDRGRSFGGPNDPRSAMETKQDARDHEMERFAREVAGVLEDGVAERAYERLIVVAPPHFLGLLRRVWAPRVAERVVAALDKDWTRVPERELPERVRTAIPETAGLGG